MDVVLLVECFAPPVFACQRFVHVLLHAGHQLLLLVQTQLGVYDLVSLFDDVQNLLAHSGVQFRNQAHVNLSAFLYDVVHVVLVVLAVLHSVQFSFLLRKRFFARLQKDCVVQLGLFHGDLLESEFFLVDQVAVDEKDFVAEDLAVGFVHFVFVVFDAVHFVDGVASHVPEALQVLLGHHFLHESTYFSVELIYVYHLSPGHGEQLVVALVHLVFDLLELRREVPSDVQNAET